MAVTNGLSNFPPFYRMMSSPISRMLASEDANVRCAMKPFINISEFEQKQVDAAHRVLSLPWCVTTQLLAQMSNDQLYYKDGEEEDEESDEENTVQVGLAPSFGSVSDLSLIFANVDSASSEKNARNSRKQISTIKRDVPWQSMQSPTFCQTSTQYWAHSWR